MSKTKQFVTTVCIDDDEAPRDDLKFIEARGLKPTNLLRAKIKELRAIEEGEPDNKELLRRIGSFQELMSKYNTFLEKKGLLDDFFKS